MASNRLTYSKSSLIGSKIANVAQLGAQFRAALLELHLELEAYNDANTQLEADAGMASGGGAAIRSACNYATAEMTGTALAQVNVGANTKTRDLIDQTA